MPDQSRAKMKIDLIEAQCTLKPSSRHNHASSMIPDRSFHRELSSQSIMDTSFSPNTQPSKSASIINHKFIPLNDMNNAQSSELTPPKLDSTSQKTTSSTRKTTFVAKDQNNETTFISSDQNKNTHTPSSDQKTSKKQIINSTQSFEGEKKDSLEQSSPYTSKVVQRVYSVSTSSNSSPMLSALSNIRLRSNFTTDTVITNPPTPIAAGSNKVFYSMNDRISKDIAELEHSKKQPHSEGSTLVEEFNEDYYGFTLKPYSKYFELGPTFVGNRRDLNDFNEDEDRLSDTEFNNYSTSSSNKTFTELSPFKTSLKFNRCNDDSIFDSYRTMSPLGQIIKNHSRSKMTRQKSPICLSFERKTKSKKVVINNQIPMEAQSKYELQDTETSQVTSLDRKKNINEIENELLTKLSAANHTVLNAISESEAYLINVPVKKEEHLTNCLRLPKTADFHEVIPLTFIKHQRKYQCQGVDAMLVMLGWHSTWTRFLVPKIEDFYQLSKQAAERSDFVLGYSIIGKRMHPYAAFDFDKNIDTWFMEGERVFFGYAIGISVKNDDKWNKVGPGNVSVYKKNNVLWMCSLGRSKFKPWASSEAPKLLAMGIVLSFSCQEGDGFIQSININLCLNEFCLEMTAKDIAVLKTLLV